MSKDVLFKAIGAVLLIFLGAVVGYQYPSWETRPKLKVEYILPKYEVAFELPPNLVKELQGRPDFIETTEALVSWPLQPALQLNSWRRREFEELLMLQKPIEQQLNSKNEDLKTIRKAFEEHPTCEELFKLLLASRWILSGATPQEWYQDCIRNPQKTMKTTQVAVRAGLEEGERFLGIIGEFRRSLETQLRENVPHGPLIIDVGVTNFGQTEGAFNNKPILRVEEPERFDVTLRVYERPRPWERTNLLREVAGTISPDQPIISVKGQGFMTFTVAMDVLRNSPEHSKKVDDFFGRGIGKARLVFLNTQNQEDLSSSVFPLKPPVE